jgi:hypothetical protein
MKRKIIATLLLIESKNEERGNMGRFEDFEQKA